MSDYSPGSAASQGLAGCHVCFKTSPVELHECPRCGAALHLRAHDSLQRTISLLITATLLYIPANVLPIMTTVQMGNSVDSTILGGVILLVHHGSYPIAAVIFIASVLVPVSKLICMTWLWWSVESGHKKSHRERATLYRVTEFIGRWSMVDVFVVMILVALIQMGGLLQILPGTAAIAFAGVVIVAMIAAESFDPRLMWDKLGKEDEER